MNNHSPLRIFNSYLNQKAMCQHILSYRSTRPIYRVFRKNVGRMSCNKVDLTGVRSKSDIYTLPR